MHAFVLPVLLVQPEPAATGATPPRGVDRAVATFAGALALVLPGRPPRDCIPARADGRGNRGVRAHTVVREQGRRDQALREDMRGAVGQGERRDHLAVRRHRRRRELQRRRYRQGGRSLVRHRHRRRPAQGRRALQGTAASTSPTWRRPGRTAEFSRET